MLRYFATKRFLTNKFFEKSSNFIDCVIGLLKSKIEVLATTWHSRHKLKISQ